MMLLLLAMVNVAGAQTEPATRTYNVDGRGVMPSAGTPCAAILAVPAGPGRRSLPSLRGTPTSTLVECLGEPSKHHGSRMIFQLRVDGDFVAVWVRTRRARVAHIEVHRGVPDWERPWVDAEARARHR